jgi:DNA-binding NarL/FixJ family response regulator
MKIVVVDDQTAVRDGLVTILELLPGIDVVGAGADGAEAIELVEQHQPDVVLMDLRMPRVDGVEATKQVRARSPATQVVVLTTYADDESVLAALAAGAIGFLTKDASREQTRSRSRRPRLATRTSIPPRIRRSSGRRQHPLRPRLRHPTALHAANSRCSR